MLTDTTTVACPFCGADASPLHSLDDWRRTGATLCERCGSGCPDASYGCGDYIDLIASRTAMHWFASNWTAEWWGSRLVEGSDDRFEPDPVLGGLPAPLRPRYDVPRREGDDPDADDAEAIRLSRVAAAASSFAMGWTYWGAGFVGGRDTSGRWMRGTFDAREELTTRQLRARLPLADAIGRPETKIVPRDEFLSAYSGAGGKIWRALDVLGIPRDAEDVTNSLVRVDRLTFRWRTSPHDIERVPQAADAGVCEICSGSGSDNGIACVSCRLTGRIDGARGAGEDYDPGPIAHGKTRKSAARRARQRLALGWVGQVRAEDGPETARRDEMKHRASREHDYTGAPGNHLATLPAGRLVLDARKRRIERAAEIAMRDPALKQRIFEGGRRYGKTARLYDMLTVAARMAQQSPDLPRAHVSDATRTYTHIDTETRGNVQAWMHRQFSMGRAPDPE